MRDFIRDFKVLPILAVLIAVAVLAFTIYAHVTTPVEEVPHFVPPQPEVSEPEPVWQPGVEIVTPIA